jgi:hypothetical protein
MYNMHMCTCHSADAHGAGVLLLLEHIKRRQAGAVYEQVPASIHCITQPLHYITSQYITVHHNALHYITTHYMLHSNMSGKHTRDLLRSTYGMHVCTCNTALHGTSLRSCSIAGDAQVCKQGAFTRQQRPFSGLRRMQSTQYSTNSMYFVLRSAAAAWVLTLLASSPRAGQPAARLHLRQHLLAAQQSTAQHSTAQHSRAAQHSSTAQNSTAEQLQLQ